MIALAKNCVREYGFSSKVILQPPMTFPFPNEAGSEAAA